MSTKNRVKDLIVGIETGKKLIDNFGMEAHASLSKHVDMPVPMYFMEYYIATFNVRTEFSCRPEEYPVVLEKNREHMLKFIYQEQLEILDCLYQKTYAGDREGVLKLLGELGDSMR